ncbi:SDR family NAD(P)-dependent oxidoreductase [Silvimonas soli]|uniref:SDR family NAD(P)-dependent oxidoreductase n=1 Tax=Silvimonas soli TaxID=2980100 RepID=UPI0024B34FB1|nr:SDR family NAD(P)-dependent oxidoreductase [Silvimonas soli]
MWPSPLNPRLKNWSGTRVWVVGASSGIGAAVAQKLIGQGAKVALSARHFEKLELVAANRPNALVLPMDVTEPEAWEAGHAALRALWGGVDLVVFCAADYQPLRAWEIEAARARRTIEVNLTGVYFGLETILPTMLARHAGNIAIIASVAGYMGLPNATVYGPTKAALINLAELLYADLHPKGLGVFLINPGFVKTPLTARNTFTMPALLTPEQAADRILAGLARGQFQIDFPRRFTLLVQLASLLPYRWRFALLNRALGL